MEGGGEYLSRGSQGEANTFQGGGENLSRGQIETPCVVMRVCPVPAVG